jgi:hypothetical protein
MSVNCGHMPAIRVNIIASFFLFDSSVTHHYEFICGGRFGDSREDTRRQQQQRAISSGRWCRCGNAAVHDESIQHSQNLVEPPSVTITMSQVIFRQTYPDDRSPVVADGQT